MPRRSAPERRACARDAMETTEMGAIYFDRDLTDDQRRTALYSGALLLYSPRAATKAFCEFAQEVIEDAFAPLVPEYAHLELPVERYAEILAALKPAFIHHPESKRLIRGLLVDFDCDPERTYFDVPRLRTSTPGGYLTTGIA